MENDQEKIASGNHCDAAACGPSSAPGCSDPNWKTVALECLQALRLMNEHYDDLRKSNPGFIGKLCLQRYDLWNEALLASECMLRKYSHIPNPAVTVPPLVADKVDELVGRPNSESEGT